MSPALATVTTGEPKVAASGMIDPQASNTDFGTTEQDMLDVWSKYDVPKAAQQRLLATLQAGEPIDSILGGEPVSIEEHPDGSSDSVMVARYEDGSISVTSITSPGAQAWSVGDCSTVATTYALNCKVYGWYGPVQMSFRASYRKVDGRAMVYNWGQETYGCAPGTCSEPKFVLVREVQSGSLPAQIDLRTNYNFAFGNTSMTLSLFAKDRTAWTN